MVSESLLEERKTRRSASIDKSTQKNNRSKLVRSIERTAIKNIKVVKNMVDDVYQKTKTQRHQPILEVKDILKSTEIEKDKVKKQH